MKSFFATAVLALAALATSPTYAADPCDPTVPYEPSHLSCQEGEVSYWITIQTFGSPSLGSACAGDKYREKSFASVQVSIKGAKLATIDYFPGNFVYTLGGPTGTGSFDAPIPALHLDRCVAPVHGGGVSSGNRRD